MCVQYVIRISTIYVSSTVISQNICKNKTIDMLLLSKPHFSLLVPESDVTVWGACMSNTARVTCGSIINNPSGATDWIAVLVGF